MFRVEFFIFFMSYLKWDLDLLIEILYCGIYIFFESGKSLINYFCCIKNINYY